MNSNDGTTAVQVSPIPTESEMTRIRQIFEYAANAIVRASELGKQVTELEGRFKTLENDHTQVLARNDELVQSLSEIRMQRDEAQSKLVEVRSSLSNAQGEIEVGRKALTEATDKINRLEADVRRLQDELTDTISHWDKADARATQAEANLAKVKSALGIVDPPKVAPQAEPQPPDAGPVQSIISPEPRPIEPADGVDFNRPYHWDTTLNRWVND